MSAREAAVALLGELVRHPTVSGSSNLELLEVVERELARAGIEAELIGDDTGRRANLWATVGPAVDGGVVLSGHTDVVPAEAAGWSHDPFDLVERDGRLYGRGACDMKGFIACVLAELPALAAAPLARPVHLALTFDEETGCRGAPLLIEHLRTRGPRPALAIVGEPTGMAVVAGHKGGFELTTTVRGRAGHASAPGRGANAVTAAARLIARLDDMAREAAAGERPQPAFDPPHTTVSVGRIAGGTARNVIAEACAFDWEMRPLPGTDGRALLARFERGAAAEVLADMRARAPEAAIVTAIEASYPGLAFDPQSPAAALACELTGARGCRAAAFGTEAGLYQQAGIPAVVCGPGRIAQAHTRDEFIALDQVGACLAFLERLRRKLSTEAGPAEAAAEALTGGA